jgi:hypothetical protein
MEGENAGQQPDVQRELETAGLWDSVGYTLANTRSARV